MKKTLLQQTYAELTYRVPALLASCGIVCGITPNVFAAQSMLSKEDHAALAAGQSRDVIIELYDGGAEHIATERRRRAGLDHDDDAIYAERAHRYRQQKAATLKNLSGALSLEVQKDYSELPLMTARVRTQEDIDALLQQPNVKAIYPNGRRYQMLSQSLPLIRQPEAAAQGYTGAGTTVVVVDGGVNYRHAAFGSCSAPGGSCKVVYSGDIAPDDSLLDEDNNHGTNVAATVLGVAPKAKIAALDVFQMVFDDYWYEWGLSADDSDIIAAINWAITNRTKYNIVAINMSLGSDRYSTPCTSNPFATPIANARAKGILTTISSGNDGYTSAISSPACVPGAISVGAVYDSNIGPSWGSCSDYNTSADLVACYSNSAKMLTLLAPGDIITAGGVSMGGTSQAAPHVAGAIAVLRAAYPKESMDAIVIRLTKNGTPVTDPRNSITKPRLNLLAALGKTTGGTTGGTTTTTEVFPPQGKMPAGWTAPYGSSANWSVASDWASEGTKSLRSGKLLNGVWSGVASEIQVSGNFQAGNVRFTVRTSSEWCCDGLVFYVDNFSKGVWSGETTKTVSVPITAGYHTLIWSYEKDFWGSVGSDAAWIDAVSLPSTR